MNVTVRARIYRDNVPRIVEMEIAVPMGHTFAPEDLDMLMRDDVMEHVMAHSLAHDVVAPVKPKLTVAQLNAVAPRMRYCNKLRTDSPCSICQTAFRAPKFVRKLPCGHLFCGDCIATWVTKHSASCPVCRNSVLISEQ